MKNPRQETGEGILRLKQDRHAASLNPACRFFTKAGQDHWSVEAVFWYCAVSVGMLCQVILVVVKAMSKRFMQVKELVGYKDAFLGMGLRFAVKGLIYGLVTLTIFSNSAQAQRVALLVGNANYSSDHLINPYKDVTLMERALKGLGFNVMTVLDANRMQMKRALRSFGAAAENAEVAFFFYSGKADARLTENYLHPLDANIDSEMDHALESIAVRDVLLNFHNAHAKTSVLVINAYQGTTSAGSTKGAIKGLVEMAAPPNTLISFAADPGSYTIDNGLFAKVLSRELQDPRKDLIDVFRSTVAEVRHQSAGRQVPSISTNDINNRFQFALKQHPSPAAYSLDSFLGSADFSPPSTKDDESIKRRLSEAGFKLMSPSPKSAEEPDRTEKGLISIGSIANTTIDKAQ